MDKGLKIGLIGSASSGKSTTATMLHKALGIELHKELESRLIQKLINNGIIKNRYSFKPHQSKKFQNHALSIRERLSQRDSFISDRTAGELWVYYQIYCAPYCTQDEVLEFRKSCLKVMKRYTHLFL